MDSATRHEANARWRRDDSWALLLCSLAGFALAVAPHWAALWRNGTLEYLADNDDVVYMAVARAPYYGEGALRDPFVGRWEGAPALYSWLQFVPLAKLTAFLGLPQILMTLVWRAVGGPAFGGALFLLFRRLFAQTRFPAGWALGCSLICLADAGFVGGRTMVDSMGLLGYLWRGTTPMTKADALAQFRVVQPLLHLPVLFLLAASFTLRTARSAVLAGALCLGALVLLNFFFWTAAAGALGLYLVWSLLRGRTDSFRRARVAASVLAGGLAIGAPQIYGNSRTAAKPEYKAILNRLDKPFHLAPGDPVRRRYVRNFWVWGKLAVGAAAILSFGAAGLEVPWFLTLTGYLLCNLALFTGFEFDNSHWLYIHAPMGEIMALASMVLFLDRREMARRWLWVLPAGLLGLALVWRPYEALAAQESSRSSKVLEELRPLQASLARIDSDAALAGPPETSIALMFSRGALLSPPALAGASLIPDEQVHERNALNAWLEGYDLPAYLKVAAENQMCAFSGPQWEAKRVASLRAAIFKRLLEGGERELLARYRPVFLLLRASAPAPRRAGPWRLVQRSAQWALWSRRAA